MDRMRWRAGALLVGMSMGAVLLLAACAGSSDSSSDDDSSGASGSVSIPDYTLQSEDPADCAVENEDGSIETAAGCHVHIVLNDAVSSNHVRMKVEGTFLASQVFPLLLASNTGASDGWVLQYERGFTTPDTAVQFSPCFTEGCSNSANFTTETFSGASYSQGDDFTLWVDVDEANSTIRAWLDSNPTDTPGGELSHTIASASGPGSLVGVSINGARINVIEVTENP